MRVPGYRAALAVELVKVRRSPMPLATLGVACAIGAVAALFMFILADPARAHRLGLLGQKASLTGLSADWPGLLTFLAQAVAVGGLLLFAFIAAWVFGREFADGATRYLLALPVARTAVVAAKFTVVAGWAALLSAWLIGVFLAVGWALGLPGGGSGPILSGLGTVALAAVLMLVATTPVAFVACAGRGYLMALASAVGAVVVAQIAAALGWGSAIPWSVPAVAAGLVPDTGLGPVGVAVVALTGLAGVVATGLWWRGPQAGR